MNATAPQRALRAVRAKQQTKRGTRARAQRQGAASSSVNPRGRHAPEIQTTMEVSVDSRGGIQSV